MTVTCREKSPGKQYVQENSIVCGRSEKVMSTIRPESVACSIWSPPYHVGKEYEKGQTFEGWLTMLSHVIAAHFPILIPGGFMVVNIADILCFPDPVMPRIQLPNPNKHKSSVTREDVLKAKAKHPDFNRYQLATFLGCSEQTVDRRINGNNIRGGKYNIQTRVQLVGTYIQDIAKEAGLFLYDRRIWKKDPAWQNSQWHCSSYKAVDEFEYLFFFWKPGETVVNRNRLTRDEWVKWGSRAVWNFPSVRANDCHEAMFPIELPRRCIHLLTEPGDTVLDPFMGSGTTALAAIELGRKFIGIEKCAQYVELAKEKIRKFRRELELPLFDR